MQNYTQYYNFKNIESEIMTCIVKTSKTTFRKKIKLKKYFV